MRKQVFEDEVRERRGMIFKGREWWNLGSRYCRQRVGISFDKCAFMAWYLVPFLHRLPPCYLYKAHMRPNTSDDQCRKKIKYQAMVVKGGIIRLECINESYKKKAIRAIVILLLNKTLGWFSALTWTFCPQSSFQLLSFTLFAFVIVVFLCFFDSFLFFFTPFFLAFTDFALLWKVHELKTDEYQADWQRRKCSECDTFPIGTGVGTYVPDSRFGFFVGYRNM